MLSCLIIADDFTGACDTGLQFARAGLRSAVAVDMEQIHTRAETVDVLAANTETRNCSRLEAEDRVREVCKRLSGLEPALTYKKVDSALRGNLATEIRTAMQELRLDLCLMAPAFPEAGRITVGGYHLVHGVPVERSEVGHDPGSPVRGSFLPHLLDIEGDLAIHTVGLEEIAQGPEHIAAIVEGVRGTGPTLIVMDAASPEDLHHVAAAAARMSSPPLLCGSAGLAAQIPETFGWEGSPREPAGVSRADGPILLVVGSAESTTRRQVEALRRSLDVSEWEVHVEATAFAWERPHMKNLVEEVGARMSNGGDAVLSLVGLHPGIAREEVTRAIRALAEVVCKLADRVRPAGILATGGWTASEVLKALGGEGVEILEGISAGAPLCRIDGGPFQGLQMVTKGGALGEEDVLVRAVERIRGPEMQDEAAPRPLLGITMGDAAGVGPEVIVKALGHPEVYAMCRPLVIGHPEILKAHLKFAGRPLEVRPVDSPEAGEFRPGTIDVWNPVAVDISQIETGTVCPEAGRAAAEWVIAAVDLAMAGRIDGIVTAPLNKEAMNRAGFHYAGHTELLAERCGGHDVRLMLASERLNVVHTTGHVALRDVSARLTMARVFDTIALLHRALVDMGRPNPRIAVCGLNPHAGESGLFGHEDAETIRPAVEQAQRKGWDVAGPLPPDTTFFKAYDGTFDGVVAMYHDQGHAPVKLVAFEDAVNVTLGLPIVRTSVDHGTAFDIAGKGVADETNMLRALRVGATLARQGIEN